MHYGYKLHAVCGLCGVIHSFDITKANVHDINYLKDVKYEFHDCGIFGDRGYVSASMQLDLFESANVRLEVPYRLSQKDWKPTFGACQICFRLIPSMGCSKLISIRWVIVLKNVY